MIVEDGRRLLISNLDLDRPGDPGMPGSGMVLASGHLISDSCAGTNPGNYSLSALEFYRIFPEGQGLFLSTAVRIGAVISIRVARGKPANRSPAACGRCWVLRQLWGRGGDRVDLPEPVMARQEHRGRTPRANPRLDQRQGALDVAEAPVSFWETASRGFQFFTSPIDGVSSARSSSSSFRNDREVEFLGDVFENLTRDKVKEPKRFFSTVIFENSASVTLNPPPEWPDKPEAASAGVPPQHDAGTDVSMSWYLTRAERRSIRSALPSDPPRGSAYFCADFRRKRMAAVSAQVLQDPPGPDRDIKSKRLERLRNYERLQMLKRWWAEAGSSSKRARAG